MVDRGSAMAAPRVQLFDRADNGWPHNALRVSLAYASHLPLPSAPVLGCIRLEALQVIRPFISVTY